MLCVCVCVCVCLYTCNLISLTRYETFPSFLFHRITFVSFISSSIHIISINQLSNVYYVFGSLISNIDNTHCIKCYAWRPNPIQLTSMVTHRIKHLNIQISPSIGNNLSRHHKRTVLYIAQISP